MLITIRTDASQQIGYGHVMRCLALAEALRDLGATIEFITRIHLGNLDEYIKKKSFKVHSLPKPLESELEQNFKGFAEWLDFKIKKDAQESIQVLEGTRPDWLIIDHYAIDNKWEGKLRPYTRKIMVIDDQANRNHDCDLLLDQNYIHDHSRYDHLLSPDTMKLLGPKYALLRKDFSETHQRSLKSRGLTQRVLIFFGGSDPYNLTARALKSLRHPNLKHLSVDVVIGSANPHQSEIKALIAEKSNAELHIQVENIAELMANADIALGAGGTATWERMAVGLPSIVVTIAENQVPFTRELHRDGYLKWLGNANQVEEFTICNALLEIIQEPHLLRIQSQKGQELVNGMGAHNTAELMIFGPKFDTLKVRKAFTTDCLFYWYWANNLKFRENTLNQQDIGWEDYKERFNKILNEPDTIMLLIVCEFGPIGQVLIDSSGSHFIVNYFTAKQFREFCFEKVVLGKAIEYLKQSFTLEGAVKERNLSSSKKFTELGFCQTGPPAESCKLFSITILSDGETWMNQFIYKLLAEWAMVGHRICWVHKTSEVPEGDLCFVLSCGEILKGNALNRN
ncbi:UDP-2,4-diacetamido-2,4,6-trideoxy-beta-L-altropyranose hydrolase, partial [Deltaproteobacteria bacterium]|nr:UDP-2,4-diacetamido-2,4,6-trideoxy-beta-L-altropyranose hydrolase [Deltaproteobacteria bacterium]